MFEESSIKLEAPHFLCYYIYMKKKVDNFKLVRPLLVKQGLGLLPEDCCCMVELIGRKKDNPALMKSQQHFGSYFIRKPEDLDKYEAEIKWKCGAFNCRAYINLNPKPLKKIAVNMMHALLEDMETNDFNNIFTTLVSSTAKAGTVKDKKLFVIDVDDVSSMCEAYEEVKEAVVKCGQLTGPDMLPTVNGMHVLSAPFDCQMFNVLVKTFKHCTAEVKHNAPTLLYADLKESDEE